MGAGVTAVLQLLPQLLQRVALLLEMVSGCVDQLPKPSPRDLAHLLLFLLQLAHHALHHGAEGGPTVARDVGNRCLPKHLAAGRKGRDEGS